MRRPHWRLIILLLIPTGGGIVGRAGYLWWAHRPLAYPLAPVHLPQPNARDDFMAAGRLCYAAGGATVKTASGKPLLRNGKEVQAYEPGVSLAQLRAVVGRNQPALARTRQGFRKQFGT